MSPLSALADPEFWRSYGQKLRDVTNRGVAAAAGGPVDLATMVMRPFGYDRPDSEVFGSSEYIGKRMQDAGMVGDYRNPLLEMISSIATPAGMVRGAPVAARAAQAAAANAMIPQSAGIGQRGMIRTSFGRIPETNAEKLSAVEMLERQGLLNGYVIDRRGNAIHFEDPNFPPEKFATINFDGLKNNIVSNEKNIFHVEQPNGMVNPNLGTQEQAYRFLEESGFPINRLRRFSVQRQNPVDYSNILDDRKLLAEKFNQQAIEKVANDGFMLETIKTKNGKRYEAYKPDGTKVIARSYDIPEEIKTGNRRDLWNYIIGGEK
jgi:hypothetical protein